MLDFISKDVREYMEQNHLEFTDFEKAALIYDSGLPVLRMLELLEQLAEKTEDASLKKQILARLASDRQDLEAFRGNTEGYGKRNTLSMSGISKRGIFEGGGKRNGNALLQSKAEEGKYWLWRVWICGDKAFRDH